MAPHGAFPCRDEAGVGDRWVAIACRSDADWIELASVIGVDASRFPTLAARKAHEDDVERLVAEWTKTRTRAEVARELQAKGVEAVPVEDFADLHEDPQLALRKHFVPHTHAFLGPGLYERNGFRMSDAPGGYDQAGPTLGQDSDWVLRDLLGCTDAEIERLKASGAVE
jgi:benzylsuccinate CoA-transferase BbsF subunit